MKNWTKAKARPETECKWEDCVRDDMLYIPGITPAFVVGYSCYSRGKRYFEVETRLSQTHKCWGGTCRAKWWGYSYEPRQGAGALYKCKHGIHQLGLVAATTQMMQRPAEEKNIFDK